MNHAGPRLTPEILPCNRIGRPGGGLVSCEQVGDYQPHLVAWLVKFSSLNVGCLVSLSVTWKVVGLVSSGRTYPLLVGWLISQLVSRLVTWLLLGE